jgi:2-succinyl-5-enolpyruvyl-6-hydroxy-3-cyclohexene-1-carboxylate synthase
MVRSHGVDQTWREEWVAVDRMAASSIDATLNRIHEPFEGRAIAELAALLPDGATLVVGNSMPVRDAEMFVRGDSRRVRIVGNRGASGIDGVVSSALGAAAVSHGPVVLVVGDLSFYHDLNGLLAAMSYRIPATIVVLNNNGGGIFSFLPQAQQVDAQAFEILFGTPTNLDFSNAARLYGCHFARPLTWSAFRSDVREAITRTETSVIEFITERCRNLELHREVASAVINALRHQPNVLDA